MQIHNFNPFVKDICIHSYFLEISYYFNNNIYKINNYLSNSTFLFLSHGCRAHVFYFFSLWKKPCSVSCSSKQKINLQGLGIQVKPSSSIELTQLDCRSAQNWLNSVRSQQETRLSVKPVMDSQAVTCLLKFPKAWSTAKMTVFPLAVSMMNMGIQSMWWVR